MTPAVPIASRGTSAHLPAGLVVLHPARTASASTVSASTVQGVLVCLRLRSLFALLVRLMHPVLRRRLCPPTLPAVYASAASAQISSVAQAPGTKSILLAKGGEFLRSVPGSIRRLGTVRGFLKGLPLLTLAALIVLGAISFFGPAASASVENASVTRTVVVVKHGETPVGYCSGGGSAR